MKKHLPHTESAPKARTINGFYFVPEERAAEEKVFAAEHDAAMAHELDESLQELLADYDGISNDERYRRVRTFIDARTDQLADHENGGNPLAAAVAAFNALDHARAVSDSHYLRRLVEWAMLREAHYVAGQGQDGEPLGDSEQFATDPDTAPVATFIAEQSAQFPDLGDDDFYPPSPYADVYQKGSYGDVTPSEQELAIETVHAFGLQKLDDISEAARTQLFHTGVNWTTAEYERVVRASQELTPEQRAQFAEAFLATEFGDDLGDIILDLADTYEMAELSPILERINSIRENGARMSGTLFDQEFAMNERGATAFIKRTTELLALAKEEGLASVADVLSELDSATSEAAEAIEHGVFRVTDATTDHGTLQAVEHRVTITARPSGRNARLGITVRRPGKERLSMRLDYEDGKLSMDIGSTGVVSTNASSIGQKVGQTLARGELALARLRAERAITQGVEQQVLVLHGNHVREAFDDLPHMQPAEFAGIVNRALYRLRLAEDATDSRIAA